MGKKLPIDPSKINLPSLMLGSGIRNDWPTAMWHPSPPESRAPR